jgi:hypothetical protein
MIFHHQEVIGLAAQIVVKIPQVLPIPQRQQPLRHLGNAMAYQQPIGTVVRLLTNAVKGVVIVIRILIALEV